MEVMTPVMEVETVHQRNGRIYPLEVMTRAVEEFDRHVRNNHEAIPGEAHPVPDELAEFLNMANCSHVVKHCYMQHGKVIVKLKLINKYGELSKMGVRFTGVLRTLDYDENGQRMFGSGKVTGALHRKVHSCKIITVDLKYRDEEDEGAAVHS